MSAIATAILSRSIIPNSPLPPDRSGHCDEALSGSPLASIGPGSKRYARPSELEKGLMSHNDSLR